MAKPPRNWSPLENAMTPDFGPTPSLDDLLALADPEEQLILQGLRGWQTHPQEAFKAIRHRNNRRYMDQYDPSLDPVEQQLQRLWLGPTQVPVHEGNWPEIPRALAPEGQREEDRIGFGPISGFRRRAPLRQGSLPPPELDPVDAPEVATPIAPQRAPSPPPDDIGSMQPGDPRLKLSPDEMERITGKPPGGGEMLTGVGMAAQDHNDALRHELELKHQQQRAEMARQRPAQRQPELPVGEEVQAALAEVDSGIHGARRMPGGLGRTTLANQYGTKYPPRQGATEEQRTVKTFYNAQDGYADPETAKILKLREGPHRGGGGESTGGGGGNGAGVKVPPVEKHQYTAEQIDKQKAYQERKALREIEGERRVSENARADQKAKRYQRAGLGPVGAVLAERTRTGPGGLPQGDDLEDAFGDQVVLGKEGAAGLRKDRADAAAAKDKTTMQEGILKNRNDQLRAGLVAEAIKAGRSVADAIAAADAVLGPREGGSLPPPAAPAPPVSPYTSRIRTAAPGTPDREKYIREEIDRQLAAEERPRAIKQSLIAKHGVSEQELAPILEQYGFTEDVNERGPLDTIGHDLTTDEDTGFDQNIRGALGVERGEVGDMILGLPDLFSRGIRKFYSGY